MSVHRRWFEARLATLAVGMAVLGLIAAVRYVSVCTVGVGRAATAGATRRGPQGAHAVAVSASLRLRCGARLESRPELASFAALTTLKQAGRSQILDARCARRLRGCAPRRPRNRPLRVPPAAPPAIGFLSSRGGPGRASKSGFCGPKSWELQGILATQGKRMVARQALLAGGDFCGGGAPGGARSEPKLPRLLSVVSAANEASRAPRRAPQRSGGSVPHTDAPRRTVECEGADTPTGSNGPGSVLHTSSAS